MAAMSEFVILGGCPFIGKRLEDIAKKYNVRILHYHSPKIDTQTRIPYNPKAIIESYFYLKASGSDKSIRRLRLDSVKYE